MQTKLEALYTYLKGLKRVCVAFSAGIDSSFLLEAANRALDGNVLAVIAKGSMMPQREVSYARDFCRIRNISLVEIEANEFSVEAFVNNTPDRCYHCKKGIFSQIIDKALQNGFEVVAEGTNSDDTGDYRPGKKALAELGVISPLLACGFSKQEIRENARALGIDIWDKPSAACLATRVPTGERVTPELLKRIELSEQVLKDLGFKQLRVRAHGVLARIEVSSDEIDTICRPDMRHLIAEKLKETGFRYVSVDLDGYKTGNMN
ncbi:MAG: ATP-dependent sacrificial sulfur transferase LarE [Clostridia bacterium]|nr:ATP-dependent sacrificial sulfur transferase LarE [Clostridia bacterium]